MLLGAWKRAVVSGHDGMRGVCLRVGWPALGKLQGKWQWRPGQSCKPRLYPGEGAWLLRQRGNQTSVPLPEGPSMHTSGPWVPYVP